MECSPAMHLMQVMCEGKTECSPAMHHMQVMCEGKMECSPAMHHMQVMCEGRWNAALLCIICKSCVREDGMQPCYASYASHV